MKVACLLFALACFTAPGLAAAQESPPSAQPSAASQALAECVVRSTTSEDSIVLMRWLFIGIARHPSVSQMASISDAQRVDANRQMGALFNRLLLEACANQTRVALQSDGEGAIGEAFRAFGNRAMTDLMGNPDVAAGISEVGAYVDQRRLAELVGGRR